MKIGDGHRRGDVITISTRLKKNGFAASGFNLKTQELFIE